MATFTWASGVLGDWNTIADWTRGGGPLNSSFAVAVIRVPGTHTVTIVSGETDTASAVALNFAGA